MTAMAHDDRESPSPAAFQPTHAEFEFETREVMIPMRDGARLHTVFMLPKHTGRTAVILSRTAYGARSLLAHMPTGRMDGALYGYDNPHSVISKYGYIRVQQDVRGRHGSDGSFSLARGVPRPGAGGVDDATDTWDTIDWIVKNLPECNGRVGTLGISYSGYEALLALVNPHPALKVSVPMNALADAWIGDDWFHNGAFRALMLKHAYMPAASHDDRHKWYTNYYDDYDLFLHYRSAGRLGQAYGLEQLEFYRELVAHQSYDSFWADQALDRLLAKTGITVPTMLVHGLFDQEDGYGTLAVYRALRHAGVSPAQVKLVIGPWYHGQQISRGDRIGLLRFGSDTGVYFQRHILEPYLAQYLLDGAPPADIANVSAFKTGLCEWSFADDWNDIDTPADSGRNDWTLHLHGGGRLTTVASADGPDRDEYRSDPARPVPFVLRPVRGIDRGGDSQAQWQEWLVSDQRHASGRPDVLCYATDVLDHSVSTSGRPIVNLAAATSGTDSDWVVKLVDVFPPLVPEELDLSAYQLPVAMEIFRARYWSGFSTPKPVAAGKPIMYRFALPTVNHVFLTGHRIMVQIQSSWFPLYNMNPQKFVSNMMFCEDNDFQIAVQQICHDARLDSCIVLRNVAMA